MELKRFKIQQIYTFGIAFKTRQMGKRGRKTDLNAKNISDRNKLPALKENSKYIYVCTLQCFAATELGNILKYLLTAFLILPVREEIPIIARQRTLPQRVKKPRKSRHWTECHPSNISHSQKESYVLPGLAFLKTNCLLLQSTRGISCNNHVYQDKQISIGLNYSKEIMCPETPRSLGDSWRETRDRTENLQSAKTMWTVKKWSAAFLPFSI